MSSKLVHLIIKGKVQGVFYRASTLQMARQLKLVGWVQNCSNGSVEVEAQGIEENIDELIKWCKKGPQFATVNDVQVKVLANLIDYSSFEIRH